VSVAKGVTASWAGVDSESNSNLDSKSDSNGGAKGGGVGVGRDGKVAWVCAVPAQGKVNLVLQREVVVPAKTDVVGLS